MLFTLLYQTFVNFVKNIIMSKNLIKREKESALELPVITQLAQAQGKLGSSDLANTGQTVGGDRQGWKCQQSSAV